MLERHFLLMTTMIDDASGQKASGWQTLFSKFEELYAQKSLSLSVNELTNTLIWNPVYP